MAASDRSRAEPKSLSVFDLPPDFFDSCGLFRSRLPRLPPFPPPPPPEPGDASPSERSEGNEGEEEVDSKGAGEWGKEVASRWTCNTCKAEFDSLQDQRSHFKSDLHRLNVKLSIAGKNTVKEEDFGELDGDSLFEDLDVSSISGSEDEFEERSISNTGMSAKGREGVGQKLYFRLHSGDTVSVWRCLLLDESEDLQFGSNQSVHTGNAGYTSNIEEDKLIGRLKGLVCEPRDKTYLRIVLLISGGHFAGCVFDGNSIIAHKTFHRYVVRAKAGKKQSAKDGTGKAANSAGSSLRRYNEAALKKEIQELLVTWKPYIDSSRCIFVYAPSKSRQMLFDVEKPQFGFQSCRHVPMTVHRPTLKEAKRVYYHLTKLAYEVDEKASLEDDLPSYMGDYSSSMQQSNEVQSGKQLEVKETFSGSSSVGECLPAKCDIVSPPSNGNETTPLHEATKSGDAQRTLELLEEGLNPCVKDARGRTPYMLATEKEVRNTFRRFMALNLDKWDWHAANVPSPLTKEMEESQAAKQAEKDAKRKAKAKELKKLRKAKEKAQEAPKQQPQSNESVIISKEEEQRRALAAERERRAAAAERRIAALNASLANTIAAPPSGSEQTSGASDITCSCCNSSLAGKVPFHRYHYKYCSTSCMHVHREMLESG
ncbi:ankyrin repeat and zinc finger domain-containing protein 1 isoform X2 [Phoenix dactylifera]|uniref:Ankyrin repeat and zinc finger domain-containing protein 1 isoform X2 n=1 Tax=Phoenix dactylifera TaxID=42345 RepID=A0A8B7MST9_PHODC|nr:ankyrin repeat and zinc finger domain-containing protein 1 isoform X2 [Phoenix dactylifera]